MKKRIDKKVLGLWYRGQLALNGGDAETAAEYFNQITDEHPDAQRYLALTFFDQEDFEGAIAEFEIAYNMGDLKALPWLEYAVRLHEPDHPKASFFASEVARLEAEDDIDVLLSLGNIKMINNESEAALELWSRTGRDSWLSTMNLIPYVFQDPEKNFQYLLGKGATQPENDDALEDVIIDIYWDFIHQGNYEAGFTLSQYLSSLSEEKAEVHFERLLPHLWKGALEGEPYSLEMYHLAALHGMVEHDLQEIHGQYIAYGMEEIEAQNIREFEESIADSNSSSGEGNEETDIYYERAKEADAAEDQLGELTAWRDLENAGDVNGLHNFAISISKEIGLSVSFMGVDGATDHAWASFVSSVIQDDMRPGREVAALADIPAPLPTKESPFFKRVIESLEFNHIHFTVYDERRIAIPYSSEAGVQSIWLHCATIDGAETCIISTTLGLDEEGDEEGLSPAQLRTLKALFRNSELVFPNTMIDIGDVFRGISDELKPSPFVANIITEEIAYGRYFNFTDFLPSIDELVFEKATLFAGYGISSQLTGPHLDVAIQLGCQTLIKIFDQYAAMYESSAEVLALLFPHTPLHELPIEEGLLDLDVIRENPTTLSDYMHCIVTADDAEEAESHIMAGATAGISALQLLALSEALSNQEYSDGARWAEKLLSSGEKGLYFGDLLNNLGWGFKIENQAVEAMRYLKLSAEYGCANAMSTVTWQLLLQGQHKEAREFFDSHYFTIMSQLDSEEDFHQASNMRSNDALNRWALGASEEEVLAIWSDEKFQEGHTESSFFPIFIKWRNGDRENAVRELAALPAHMISELNETFSDPDEATGWFREISREASEFLSQGKPKKKGFFSRK